ncbi:MAG: hypothetical protein FWC94_04020 [Bacteroidales bacterium]|nr:hypothetical protein [Bacteroidales bacterium]
MKKSLLLACLFLFCALGKAQITIHTAQIEAFHALMTYIEKKAGGKLSCECFDGVDLQAVFDRNSKDSTLNVLIENLLNSSPYYLPERIRNIRVWLTDDGEATAQGKDAYRVAFTILPNFCVNMNAGMPKIWIRYWNHEDREQVDNAIIEFKANQKEIIKNVKSSIKGLLPNDVDMSPEINIHIITAGNRGDHMVGNDIMMEMIWRLLYEGFDLSHFTKVLKHEMHHVYYIPWLAERFGNKERNEGERLLWRYQKSFIIEGVATFFDFPLISPEGKQMSANRELITELFDEWIYVMRGLMGDSPREAFAIYQNAWGDVSVERLKRFWPGDPDSIQFAGRPTAIYYVSFNVYKLILEHGGHEKLRFVIENPEKLLSVFNELHTDCMIVPRIPEDIVVLWQNNLES